MRSLIWISLIWYTIIRHELSHALGAFLVGGRINEIRLTPGIHEELGFYWGYVSYTMEPHWIVKMLPFFIDTFSISIGFLIVIWSQIKSYDLLRLLVLFLIVSPIIDLIYNYQGVFWRQTSDVYEITEMVNSWTIHLFFVTSILLSLISIRKAYEKIQKVKLQALRG